MANIEFAVNNRRFSLQAEHLSAELTLSDFLRENGFGSCRTGCGEGGCGACAVFLSRYDAESKRPVSMSINSCLRKVATLHRCLITTAEGLGTPTSGPNILQKRFADLSAAQCGACSPGYIVAISNTFLQKPDATMQEVESSLTGNLCRCTGHRPQLSVAKSFASDSDVVDTLGGGTAPLPPPPEPLGKTIQDIIDRQFPQEWSLAEDTSDRAPVITVGGTGSGGKNQAPQYFRATSLDQVCALLGRKGSVLCGSQLSLGVYGAPGRQPNELATARSLIDLTNVAALRTGFAADEGADKKQLSVRIPAMASIAETIKFLHDSATKIKSSSSPAASSWVHCLAGLARQLQAVANPHVRQAGTIAGNLVMTAKHGFASDIATPLVALGAELECIAVNANGERRAEHIPLAKYLETEPAADSTLLILGVKFSFKMNSSQALRFVCTRHAIRAVNAHCILNAAVLVEISGASSNGTPATVCGVTAAFGNAGMTDVPYKNAPRLVSSKEFLAAVIDKPINAQTAAEAIDFGFIEGEYKRSHRQRLVKALTFRAFEEIAASTSAAAASEIVLEKHRPVVEAKHHFVRPSGSADEEKEFGAVGKSIPRPDGLHHACGTSNYISTEPAVVNQLHGSFVVSQVPCGSWKLDAAKLASAEFKTRFPDFFKFVTLDTLAESGKAYGAAKMPNVLKAMGLPFPDWALWAPADDIQYAGQPIGVVLSENATSAGSAHRMAQWVQENAVQWTHDKAKTIVTIDDIKGRSEQEVSLGPMAQGDLQRGVVKFEDFEKAVAAKEDADLIKIEHVSKMDSQLHWPIETFAATAHFEGSKIVVSTQTQGPVLVPAMVQAALGNRIKQSDIVFKQPRVGGSFGRAVVPFMGATAAVLSDLLDRRPIKMVLTREQDAGMTGGREESECDMVAYVNKKTKEIAACNFSVIKNGGCSLDLSFFQPLTLKKTFFSCYRVDSDKGALTGKFAVRRSNLPSRGPTRSPGEIEGCFWTEDLVDAIAAKLGCHSQEVREANIMKAPEDCTEAAKIAGCPVDLEASEGGFTLPQLMSTLMDRDGWRQRIEATKKFNTENSTRKRGAAVVPFRYFVSPSRGDALVNIYGDGSVLLHTGATEMGQNSSVVAMQAASMALTKNLGLKNISIPPSMFSVADNNSSVLPCQWITGGSMGTSSNAAAVIDAAEKLAAAIRNCIGEEELAKIDEEVGAAPAAPAAAAAAGAPPAAVMAWIKIVSTCIGKRVPLSAIGICTSQDGGKKVEGRGNAGPDYSIWCVGGAEIELDAATGEVTLQKIDIAYDAGRSLNPAVDIGQIEGAFVMGIGHMLTEDCQINAETGKLAAGGNTWEYKPPMPANLPRSFNVTLLENKKFKSGFLGSKATGEPPLCVAPAITSAVRQAIQSANGNREFVPLAVPWTSTRIAAACGPFMEGKK